MAGVNDIEDPYLSNSNDKNHEVVPEKDWEDIDLSDSNDNHTFIYILSQISIKNSTESL